MTSTPASPIASSKYLPLKNDNFLRACLGQPTPYAPIWLMRQAGRYLPEYRATRARAGSFMALATNPDYATEVALQPLERYALDASIVFSDILVIPDAMGLGLGFRDGEGPFFAHPIGDEAAIQALAVPDMEKLRYLLDAISTTRIALAGRVPLIGFAGSPWTLACYMVEGAGSSDHHTIKRMLYSRPELLHRILAVNADAVAACLNAQIEAGAQCVMVFDSWGGLLADGAFQTFSLAYTERVLTQLRPTGVDGSAVPRIVFTKGCGQSWLADMQTLACDVLGVDWTVNLSQARALLDQAPHTKSLQGNMDPQVLFAPQTTIEAEVQRTLRAFGAPAASTDTRCRHIFNLGHGIAQHTPPENVAVLVEAVRKHSALST